MDLFSPIVSPDKFHANFRRVLEVARTPEREELLRWVQDFPDRDGKFVREFQTTFNSSFWEIYLHRLFKEYGFTFDWTNASPDFALTHLKESFIVEAATANAADGQPAEWENDFWKREGDQVKLNIGALNREAIIRISNALLGKLRAYNEKYCKQPHVKGKPFVIAVAPFEQPNFQYQYDRPIRAVLYDYYVDEEAYLREPNKFPNGPPGVSLGFVEKKNGALIPLGIFLSDEWSEVSAVMFSCTATWGKVDVMCKDPSATGVVSTIWGGKPDGKPYHKVAMRNEYEESMFDGLQIYHNPNAKYPLDSSVFRHPGVVQHFFDDQQGEWVFEEQENCLHFRIVMNVYGTDEAMIQGSSEIVT